MMTLAHLVFAVAVSTSVASAGEFDSIVPGKTVVVFNTEKKIARLPRLLNYKKDLVSRENGKKCELAYSLDKFPSAIIPAGSQAAITQNASGVVPNYDFFITATPPYGQKERLFIACQIGLNLAQITNMLAGDGIELRDN